MSTCPLCKRPSDHPQLGLCKYHTYAYEMLQKKFQEWREALQISWEDYLQKISEADSTGIWIREVIEHLRSLDAS